MFRFMSWSSCWVSIEMCIRDRQYAKHLPFYYKVRYGSVIAAQRTDSRGSERHFDGSGGWSIYGKHLPG